MKKEKACGCIIFEGEKVLLIKQTNGDWGFPKGHVEGNETEKQTAIREVKEETNLDVEILVDTRYIMNYTIKEEIEKEVVFFIARKLNNNIKAQESEINEIRWCDINKTFEILTHENTKELFRKVLNDR